jgi:hypothetical protein
MAWHPVHCFCQARVADAPVLYLDAQHLFTFSLKSFFFHFPLISGDDRKMLPARTGEMRAGRTPS